ASAMVDAGLDDVLIANQAVGPVKAAELARLAGLASVVGAVESDVNADELAQAADPAGPEIGGVVEPAARPPRPGGGSVPEAVALGRRVDGLPGLRLRGLLGYEGHCMLEPDRAVRIQKARAANAALLEAVDAFAAAGLATEIVAAGGLGTWDITGANP